MAQKEIGRSGSGGLRVFVGWSSQEIETTERIEKKPYFPAAGNFFFGGWFFGVDGTGYCCCLVIWFGCTIDSRNS